MQAGTAKSTMPSALASSSAAGESRRSRSNSRTVSRSVSPALSQTGAPPIEVIDASTDRLGSQSKSPATHPGKDRYWHSYTLHQQGSRMDRGAAPYLLPHTGALAVWDPLQSSRAGGYFPQDDLAGLGRMDALRFPEHMSMPVAFDEPILCMQAGAPLLRNSRGRDMGFYDSPGAPVGYPVPARHWREPSLSHYAPRRHTPRFRHDHRYPHDQRQLVALNDMRELGDPLEHGFPYVERRYQIPHASRRVPHYRAHPHDDFDRFGGYMPGGERMRNPRDFTQTVDMQGSNEHEGMEDPQYWRRSSYVHRSSGGGMTSVQRVFVSTNTAGRPV